MTRSALEKPACDPTPLFDLFRMNYASELLTVAVGEFDLFRRVAAKSHTLETLREEIGLEPRPAVVLFTAIRAMGFLAVDESGHVALTATSREHLVPGSPFDLSGYIHLTLGGPSVQQLIKLLKSNRPANAEVKETGAAFIFRAGIESAMEQEASARHLTLSLSGRAQNVAPYFAETRCLDGVKCLLDVGGGSGIFAIAAAQKHPEMSAIVWDRPAVLKVADEFIAEYGVTGRVRGVAGDMFGDPIPDGVDAILLSNVLHDWDVPECKALVKKCVDALPNGGKLLVHDVFLDDDHGGPLELATYSTALFTLTEGRAYSAAEYRSWLEEAGLTVSPVEPTHIRLGVMAGVKESPRRNRPQ